MSLPASLRVRTPALWRCLRALALRALSAHVPVPLTLRPFFGLLYRAHVLAREVLLWSGRFFWFEPLFRSQCVRVGSQFRMEKLPYLTGSGRIMLGSGVRFSGKPSITFGNHHKRNPELIVGDGTFVGHDCRFHVADSVRIGRHCLLASGVRIFDLDGHPIDPDQRRAGWPTPPENIRPVLVGDDVWIGTGALILKGVHIGDRAIVGAGAVVTTDVPPDTIVAGNPARVVKRLGPPHRERPPAQSQAIQTIIQDRLHATAF